MVALREARINARFAIWSRVRARVLTERDGHTRLAQHLAADLHRYGDRCVIARIVGRLEHNCRSNIWMDE